MKNRYVMHQKLSAFQNISGEQQTNNLLNLSLFSNQKWSHKRLGKRTSPMWSPAVNISELWMHASIYMKLALVFYSEVKPIPNYVNNYLFYRLMANISLSVVPLTEIQKFLQKAGLTWRYLGLPLIVCKTDLLILTYTYLYWLYLLKVHFPFNSK